jgi:hypothetical protein
MNIYCVGIGGLATESGGAEGSAAAPGGREPEEERARRSDVPPSEGKGERFLSLCTVLPVNISVPEIIDPVFAKTSQNARFLLSENEHFGLVFVKTGSINFGTGWFIT